METMTPAVIMACGSTRLEKRLKDSGVRFVRSNITDFDDLLETVADISLGATHAIIHQRFLLYRAPRKALMQLLTIKPDLRIILITSKVTDEQTIKKILSLGIETVEDSSADLPQVLLSKLNIDEPANQVPAPSGPETEEPVIEKPAEMQAAVKPEPITMPKEKKQALKRSFQLPHIVDAIASFKPSRSVAPKVQRGHEPKIAAMIPLPEFMPDVMPKRTIVIAVYCTSHGAGGTWLSTQIAAYLAKLGKTAVSGDKDICFISKKKYKEGDPHFTYQGINFFAFTPLQDILSYGYQYIVLDVGVPLSFSRERHEQIEISPNTMADVMRADLRICISEFSPWSDFILQFYMTADKWCDLMQRSILTISSRCSEDVPMLLNAKFGRVFLPIPKCTPFEMNEEMMNFTNAVLSDCLKN